VAISESILGFVLSFLLVTVATYASTTVFTDGSSIGFLAVAAAITLFVWFAVTYLVSSAVGVAGYWVALGPLLAVLAYFLITDFLYEGTIGRVVGTWTASFGSSTRPPTSVTVPSRPSAYRRGSEATRSATAASGTLPFPLSSVLVSDPAFRSPPTRGFRSHRNNRYMTQKALRGGPSPESIRPPGDGPLGHPTLSDS